MVRISDSTKRFGARYGRRVKRKLAEVEKLRRESKKCPYCNKTGIKRIAAGIWFCKKCDTKFASGAYSVGKRIVKEAG